jgi:hypothetical protein
VTIKKEMYIQARHNSKEGVCNAYITFKSLEGKEKVMSAYDVNRVQRFAAERLCGLGSMFSNKKLLHSGFPIIIDTVEPENIAWENLGG